MSENVGNENRIIINKIMLVHIPNPIASPPLFRTRTRTQKITIFNNKKNTTNTFSHLRRASSGCAIIIASYVAAWTVVVAAGAVVLDGGSAALQRQQQEDAESSTLANIPQTLSSGCESSSAKDCKRPRIQKPKSRKAESCTLKCLTTCIRGGGGSPGEGPLNIRRPLVVFKEGFRSRQYCLVECSDICNLIGDGDDGP
ncbi:uncharacterized protein LOC126673484 isoform X2 [Mercurialis annua]|uniref:uncharacterized protein LOC126673484 isoform X2 n=1 Tax=Mercurialis annua TaxID=3986 RepID=UPI00215F1285|nr:uncharacterized protein LOC126673484 isoform X2 [Mercurialis annua]